VSEISAGWYKVAGNATDTNTLGPLVLHASATGADPAERVFNVVAFNPQDSAALGLTRLDTNIASRLASGSYTAPDNTSITAIKTKTDNLPADPASNTQVNTRLANSSYTPPDNTSITAIKAKTDNLPIDPASNTQVATRLAASSYVAPDNTDIATIKTTTDKLELMIESNGAGDYLFDSEALSNAPTGTGSGGTDWTPGELNQIRKALGVTGTTAATEPTGDLQTRLATSGYTAPDNTGIAAIQAKTDNLPATPAAQGDAMTLTSIERLTLAGVIWQAATSALTSIGSVGKLLVDKLDVNIGSRVASVDYVAPDNDTALAIKAKTDNLPASPAAQGDAMTLTPIERLTLAGTLWQAATSTFTTIGSAGKLLIDMLDAAISSRLPNQNVVVGGYVSGQTPEERVLTATLSNYAASGNVAQGITSAGNAGDPWGVDLSGYSAGQAGNELHTMAASGVKLTLTQALDTTETGDTVGGALLAARAEGFGRWVMDTTTKTISLYAADGTTLVHTLTLDDVNNPTQRS
jgi:hypothetical protein